MENEKQIYKMKFIISESIESKTITCYQIYNLKNLD